MAPPRTPVRPKPPAKYRELTTLFDAGKYSEVRRSEIALLPYMWIVDLAGHATAGIHDLPYPMDPGIRDPIVEAMDSVVEDAYSVRRFRDRLRDVSEAWDHFVSDVVPVYSGRRACWLECSLPLVRRILYAMITSHRSDMRTLGIDFSLTRDERLRFGYVPAGELSGLITAIEGITENAEHLSADQIERLLDAQAAVVTFPALRIAQGVAYERLDVIHEAIVGVDAAIDASSEKYAQKVKQEGGGGEGPQVKHLGAARAVELARLISTEFGDSVLSSRFDKENSDSVFGGPDVVLRDLDAERPARLARIRAELSALPKLDAFELDRPFVGLIPHYHGEKPLELNLDPFSLWEPPSREP